MRVDPRELWQGLLAPLQLAAYAVIALIAWSQLGGNAPADLRPWLALTLLAFVVGWLGCEVVERLHTGAALAYAALGLQIVAALANLALAYDGISPILLVLVAAQLPSLMPVPRALVVLAVLDVVLYGLLSQVHALSRPLFFVAVFATFQLFALLTSWFAVRAERANGELAAVNAQLLATRSLLEAGARDGERLRLSRELHDVVGHSLTALKLNLELAQRLPDGERAPRLATAIGLVEALLDDIRGVVGQLRRHDGIDLPAALATLAAGFPGVDVSLEVAPDLRLGHVDRAEAVLRAVQEALTNAVRHGRARRVHVALQRDGDVVRFQVRDEGRGSAVPRFGHGLTGMQERLREHGGALQVQPAAGGGLQLDGHLLDPSSPAA